MADKQVADYNAVHPSHTNEVVTKYTLAEWLDKAFFWVETKQGGRYWANVYHDIQNIPSIKYRNKTEIRSLANGKQ